MAVDIFMTFAGAKTPSISIPDNTLDQRSKGYAINSISLGIENQVSIGAATAGAGAGKATFQELAVTKPVDAITPTLALALFTGSHYDTVTFDFFVAGAAKPASIYTVACKMVFITKIEQSVSQGDDRLTETITLRFGAIQLKSRPQNRDGTLGKEVMSQWSQVRNNNTFEVQ